MEDDIIDIIITTSKRLKLDADAISVGQPIVHLLGRTMQLPSINETGYTLPIQVKPYLSSAQCGPFDITLTHNPQGRFRNALEKTKKIRSYIQRDFYTLLIVSRTVKF